MRYPFKDLPEQILDMEWACLECSVRLYNALKDELKIQYIRDLVDISDIEFKKTRLVGINSYFEILECLIDVCEQQNLPVPASLQDAHDHFYDYKESADGYVYLLEWQGFYKIGKSENVERRIKNLLTLPTEINLIHKIAVKGEFLSRAEGFMHKKFAAHRLEKNGFKEWFVLPQDCIDWICAQVDGSLDNHPELPIRQKPISWRTAIKNEQNDSRTMPENV